MRVCLRGRMNERVDKDKRVSKYNYGESTLNVEYFTRKNINIWSCK